jgi:hypothetical protein
VKPTVALAGLAVGLGSMAAAPRLQFIPTWRIAHVVILGAGFAAALLFIVILARWRWIAAPPERRWTAAGTLLILVVVCAFTLVLVWDTFGITYLGGEELAESVQSADGHQTIFVYNISEVPDGIVGARVAVRDGLLPLERTILRTPATTVEVRREGGEAVLLLDRSEQARYEFATGHLTWTDRRDSRRAP